MEYSKNDRLHEFFRRLLHAKPAQSSTEARDQLTKTLNEVENELTSIPYNPTKWASDGRLYPPMDDNIREVAGRKGVIRLRQKAHNTFIGENGAIEIRDLKGNVLFQKDGADGKGV